MGVFRDLITMCILFIHIVDIYRFLTIKIKHENYHFKRFN